jgi:hypothetical protein
MLHVNIARSMLRRPMAGEHALIVRSLDMEAEKLAGIESQQVR